MEKNYLVRLQNWYRSNCNGEWEHSYGISINTLDNPGWKVEIDLLETCLADAKFSISHDNGDDDWYIIKTEDDKFIGSGDFNKLNKILEVFFEEFLINNINKNFLYDLFVPISDINKNLFRPVHATMINENTFEIVEIKDLKENKRDIQFFSVDDLNGIDLENLQEDLKLSVGDIVNCDLKSFFSQMGLVIVNKGRSDSSWE